MIRVRLGAQRPGGLDELLLPQRQEFAADQPGQAGPDHQPDDQRQHQRPGSAEPLPEHGGDHQHRDGDDDVGEAHQRCPRPSCGRSRTARRSVTPIRVLTMPTTNAISDARSGRRAWSARSSPGPGRPGRRDAGRCANPSPPRNVGTQAQCRSAAVHHLARGGVVPDPPARDAGESDRGEGQQDHQDQDGQRDHRGPVPEEPAADQLACVRATMLMPCAASARRCRRHRRWRRRRPSGSVVFLVGELLASAHDNRILGSRNP